MRKKLLFITPIFPKNTTEDHVVPFISQFTSGFATTKNVTVDVISLMYPFTSKKYSINGVTVYPTGSKFRTFIWQIPYFFKAIAKGYQLNKQNDYDGILCFWYRESALIGKVLSVLTAKKQVVWMLGQDINRDNKFIALLKIPIERLIMMSAQQRDLFFKYHKINVAKIANVAVTRNLFPEFNFGERKIDVLGVGNLGALKNYTLFIEIIAQLKNQKCNAVLIGDGEEMALLKSKTLALGLEKRVQFLGAKSHKEVLDYMNNATLFLHTSVSEGGGTVLQEALFSGCKVVSTIAVENLGDSDDFYFSKNKEELIRRVDCLLESNLVHQRVENFKMEDAIEVIYDSFYND